MRLLISFFVLSIRLILYTLPLPPPTSNASHWKDAHTIPPRTVRHPQQLFLLRPVQNQHEVGLGDAYQVGVTRRHLQVISEEGGVAQPTAINKQTPQLKSTKFHYSNKLQTSANYKNLDRTIYQKYNFRRKVTKILTTTPLISQNREFTPHHTFHEA